MTQGKSLAEDSERFYNLIFGITGCSESLAERAADAIVEHLETTAAVLKDRLPADDRELVERLRSSAKAFRENSVFTSDGDEVRLGVQADECDQAADRIIAYSFGCFSGSRGEDRSHDQP